MASEGDAQKLLKRVALTRRIMQILFVRGSCFYFAKMV